MSNSFVPRVKRKTIIGTALTLLTRFQVFTRFRSSRNDRVLWKIFRVLNTFFVQRRQQTPTLSSSLGGDPVGLDRSSKAVASYLHKFFALLYLNATNTHRIPAVARMTGIFSGIEKLKIRNPKSTIPFMNKGFKPLVHKVLLFFVLCFILHSSLLITHCNASLLPGSIMKDISRDTDKGVVAEWPMSSATLKAPSEGVLGGMYTFDGADDYVDTGSDWIGTKAITVTGWIKPSSLGETAGRIIDNGKFSFSLFSSNNQFYITSDGGSSYPVSAVGSITFNQWNFVAGTRATDGTVNLYIGDVNTPPTLSNLADQASGTPVAGTTNVIIGNRTATDRTFDGSMYDLQIHEGVLTTTQITDIYNHKSVSPHTLLAHYKMDEGAGTTVFDSAPQEQYGRELIDGGGFVASGEVSNWNNTSTTLSHETSVPISGSGSMRCSETSGNGLIINYGTAILEANKNYRIKFKIKVLSANNSDAVLVYYRSDGGGSSAQSSIHGVISTGTVYEVDEIFASGADNIDRTRFAIQYYYGTPALDTYEILIDDVSIREVLSDPYNGTITNATLSTFHSTQDDYSFWNDVGYGTTSGNKLSNGSFEANTTGWVGYQNTTVSQEADSPLEGTGSLKASYPGSGGYFVMGYDNAFETEKTYRVKFDFKITNTTDNRSVLIYRGTLGSTTDSIQTSTDYAGSVWHHYDKTFTTTATDPTNDFFAIEITGATNATDLLLDNVSIVETGDDVRYPALSGSTSEDLWGNDLPYTQGTTTIARTRPSVPSATFDGTDDIISLPPDLLGLGTGTVSAWIKSDSNHRGAILGWGDNGTTNWGSFEIGPSTGAYEDEIITYVNNGGSSLLVMTAHDTETSNSYLLSDDTWHHLVAVVDGTENTIYLDGIKQTISYATGDASTDNAFLNTGGDTVFSIGNSTYSSGHIPFNGSIADIRIYNRALSSDEVSSLYNSGDIITNGLVGHWPLSEGAGSVVYDTTTATDPSELVTNGNFDAYTSTSPTVDFTDWTETEATGAADWAYDGGGKVTVTTKATNEWELRFTRTIPLIDGKKYRLSLKIKTDQATAGVIPVGVQETVGYTNLESENVSISSSDGWKSVSMDFTSQDGGFIFLHPGKVDAWTAPYIVWFKDVSLVEIGNNGTIVNADLSTFWGSTQDDVSTNYNFVRGTGEEEAEEIVQTADLIGRWELDTANQSYGSEMYDSAASTFESGTYAWTAWGTNTLANVGNALTITFVDTANGGYNYLRDSSDLNTDLTVGKRYRITFDAKTVGGTAAAYGHIDNDPLTNPTTAVLTTTLQTYTLDFEASSTASDYFSIRGLSAGNVITVDNVTLTEIHATDSSVNSNTGTYYGDTTLTTGHNGETDGALVFDGTGDYVLIPDQSFNDSAPWTLSAWVYQTGTKYYEFVFGNRNETEKSINMDNTSGKIQFRATGGTYYDWDIGYDYTNAWHHFTWIGSGATTVELLVDGVSHGTVAADSSFSLNGIGRAYTTNDWDFAGKIDDVRIYDRALTGEEVQQIYDEGTVNVPALADDSGFDSRGTPLDRVANLNPPTVIPLIDSTISDSPAATFDGTADFVNLGQVLFQDGDKLTIGAWIKPSVLSGTQTILMKNGPFLFRLINDKLHGSIYPPWTYITGTISLSVDEWQYVMMIYDGVNISLYVNGQFDDSVPKTGNLASNGCLQIGRQTSGSCSGDPDNYFNGSIADVRIWDRALASDEITDLATNGSPINEGLVGWWPLSEGAGADIYDVANPGVGDDVVTNGDFETDSGWTKGTGWTIANGVASSDGTQSAASDLSQDGSVSAGDYEVQFTVSSRTAGTVTAMVGSTGSGSARSADGTYTQTITYAGTGSNVYLQADADFVGSVDNFTVRPVYTANHGTATFGTGGNATFWGTTQDFYHYNDKMGFSRDRSEKVTNGGFDSDTGWTKGTGVVISGGTMDFTDGDTRSNLSIGIEPYKSYLTTYTISNYSAGSAGLLLGGYGSGGGLSTIKSANGTYSEIITPTNALTNSSIYIHTQDDAFVGSIDNVSVVEVGEIPARQLSSVDAAGTALSGGVQKVADIGGSELHGTLHNGVTLGYDQKGVVDGAMVFDGVDDYMLVLNDAIIDTSVADVITISLWVKADENQNPPNSRIFWKGNYSDEGYGMWQPNGLTFDTHHPIGERNMLDGGGNIADNTWHHLVGTYDKNAGSGNKKIYVDGIFKNSTTLTESIGTGSYDLFIGATGAGSLSFKGSIADFQIYNRALSSWEVEKLYNEGSQ